MVAVAEVLASKVVMVVQVEVVAEALAADMNL
jgi:hypothetical protein